METFFDCSCSYPEMSDIFRNEYVLERSNQVRGTNVAHLAPNRRIIKSANRITGRLRFFLTLTNPTNLTKTLTTRLSLILIVSTSLSIQ